MIDFEIWTPIKSGTTTPYNFAWPADVEETLIFPTQPELDAGFGGSGQGPSFTTIAPAGHPLSRTPPQVTTVTLSCNGSPFVSGSSSCRADHGHKKPSDRGDEKPEVKTPAGGNGGINTGTGPVGGSGGAVKDCCEIAKRAEELARKALGEQPGSSSGQPDDQFKKLPKQCGGNCLAIVSVTRSTVTSVNQPPVTAMPGASGAAAGWTDTGTECFTFNSHNAAVAFRVQINEAWSDLLAAGGHVNGNNYRRIASNSAPQTDQSEDQEFGGGVCPEPDEQKMVGYEGPEE